jgi:hypothetical protein
MIRKLRKYVIIVYRGDGLDSAPCQLCGEYLKQNGFRKVVCYKDGELVKFDLQNYSSDHLSYAQRKLIEQKH